GGVGKTTTAANLGGGLARLGHRVLLIDIDPQANLSLHLNVDIARTEGKSIYDLLVRDASVEEAIVCTEEENLQIIPSHIDLCSAELELVNTVGREVILRDALRKYTAQNPESPDYVLIDCPPSLGLLSLNALVLAQEVIIPIQAEFFALQGMGKLMEVVRLVKTRLNTGLEVSGIVICMYKAQTTLAKEVLNEVESYFGGIVYQSKIRQNIKLAEAPSHGQTIFAYDPYSNGAKDYMELAREVTGEQEASTPESISSISQEEIPVVGSESPQTVDAVPETGEEPVDASLQKENPSQGSASFSMDRESPDPDMEQSGESSPESHDEERTMNESGGETPLPNIQKFAMEKTVQCFEMPPASSPEEDRTASEGGF
ncbi:MAG: ParA family protein, partial [Planctomycetes bacterium]|nr:ParA family protein [Planctomycetota bacterium]